MVPRHRLRPDFIKRRGAANGLVDALGNVPMPMTPTELGKFIADETEKWGKLIRAAKIKPE